MNIVQCMSSHKSSDRSRLTEFSFCFMKLVVPVYLKQTGSVSSECHVPFNHIYCDIGTGPYLHACLKSMIKCNLKPVFSIRLQILDNLFTF